MLALLLAAQLVPQVVPVVPSCATTSPTVEVLGPGPDEIAPLNTSLWFSLSGGNSPDAVPDVTLRNKRTDTPVPLHQEVVYAISRTGEFGDLIHYSGLRFQPDVPLDGGTMYTIEWRFLGQSGGHEFGTSPDHDDEAPSSPRVISVESVSDQLTCAETYGVEVVHDGDRDLLYLPIVQGAPVGLARADRVPAHIGQSDVQVVGALVAMDLAGNRAAAGTGFSGKTPTAPAPRCSGGLCEDDGVFSCATTGPHDGLAALLVAGLALFACRRGARAR